MTAQEAAQHEAQKAAETAAAAELPTTTAAAETKSAAAAPYRKSYTALEQQSVREVTYSKIEEVIAHMVERSDSQLLANMVEDPDPRIDNVCVPLSFVAGISEVRSYVSILNQSQAVNYFAKLIGTINAQLMSTLPRGVYPPLCVVKDSNPLLLRTCFKRKPRSTLVVRGVPADATETDIRGLLLDISEAASASFKRVANGCWLVMLDTEEHVVHTHEQLIQKELKVCGKPVSAGINWSPYPRARNTATTLGGALAGSAAGAGAGAGVAGAGAGAGAAGAAGTGASAGAAALPPGAAAGSGAVNYAAAPAGGVYMPMYMQGGYMYDPNYERNAMMYQSMMGRGGRAQMGGQMPMQMPMMVPVQQRRQPQSQQQQQQQQQQQHPHARSTGRTRAQGADPRMYGAAAGGMPIMMGGQMAMAAAGPAGAQDMAGAPAVAASGPAGAEAGAGGPQPHSGPGAHQGGRNRGYKGQQRDGQQRQQHQGQQRDGAHQGAGGQRQQYRSSSGRGGRNRQQQRRGQQDGAAAGGQQSGSHDGRGAESVPTPQVKPDAASFPPLPTSAP